MSLDLAQSVKHTGMNLIRDEFARALSIFAGAELKVRSAHAMVSRTSENGNQSGTNKMPGEKISVEGHKNNSVPGDIQQRLDQLNKVTNDECMQVGLVNGTLSITSR